MQWPSICPSASLTIPLLLFGVIGFESSALAQAPAGDNGTALNLTVGEVDLAIGDSKRTTGIPLNYRDRVLQRVNGMNRTLWRPHDEAMGTVNGLAVGLPLTGADQLRGVGVGGGLATESTMDGIVGGRWGSRAGSTFGGSPRVDWAPGPAPTYRESSWAG